MLKYFLLGLLGLSLSVKAQKHPTKSSITKHPVYKTLTLSTPCAVLYSPNDARIAQMKKPDSLAFYTVAGDMMFYNAQTSEYLRKHKIKVVDTDATFLLFAPSGAPIKAFDLRHSTYGWGLILFNGRNTPKEADLLEPESDVKKVFGK